MAEETAGEAAPADGRGDPPGYRWEVPPVRAALIRATVAECGGYVVFWSSEEEYGRG